jgi:aminoacyl tRNA synthase complex-interacting multifunctional protein 1
VKYVPLEEMQQRQVIVLCNLKARNMRGIKSNGMLLAASDEAHENVEPLAPPTGATPGSRVWFGQHQDQVGHRWNDDASSKQPTAPTSAAKTHQL